jgi:hypothetical protein
MKIDKNSHEPIDKPLNIDLEGENEDNKVKPLKEPTERVELRDEDKVLSEETNNIIFDKLESMKKEDVRITLKKYIGSLKNKGDKAFQGLDIDEVISWIEEQKEPEDKGEISDGYHTFNELYYYRMLYNAAFFNTLPKDWVHKSLRHHTGEECFGGGWFIVGIDTPKGSYTYHYENNFFSLFDCEELERGKPWDGHTEKDVTRLLSLC